MTATSPKKCVCVGRSFHDGKGDEISVTMYGKGCITSSLRDKDSLDNCKFLDPAATPTM